MHHRKGQERLFELLILPHINDLEVFTGLQAPVQFPGGQAPGGPGAAGGIHGGHGNGGGVRMVPSC